MQIRLSIRKDDWARKVVKSWLDSGFSEYRTADKQANKRKSGYAQAINSRMIEAIIPKLLSCTSLTEEIIGNGIPGIKINKTQGFFGSGGYCPSILEIPKIAAPQIIPMCSEKLIRIQKAIRYTCQGLFMNLNPNECVEKGTFLELLLLPDQK